MEKIQELVKEGKLAENLMADKEFVEGAKEILKSEKIEMDDKKLAQLMNEIETQLKKGNMLDDKELEEVSGGLTGKGVGADIIKTVSTLVGIRLGGFAAHATGVSIAGGSEKFKEQLERYVQDTQEYLIDLKKSASDPTYKSTKSMPFNATVISVGAGGIAGNVVGGVAGYQLGKWICKKTGLEEE